MTGKQWLQIIGSVIAGLITGAALLQTLLGQDLALKVVAVLGIANIIVGSVGAAISGQANLIKDVAAMPGIERITMNAQASQAAAQVATDPQQPKVGASSPEVREILKDTAKAAA